jgi:hypothetical protein
MGRPQVAIEHASHARINAAQPEVLIFVASPWMKRILESDAERILTRDGEIATP